MLYADYISRTLGKKIAMINMFKKLDDTMEKSQYRTGNFFFFKETNGNARTETMNKINWV